MMARPIAESPTELEETFLLPNRPPTAIRPLRNRDERPIREADFVRVNATYNPSFLTARREHESRKQ